MFIEFFLGKDETMNICKDFDLNEKSASLQKDCKDQCKTVTISKVKKKNLNDNIQKRKIERASTK